MTKQIISKRDHKMLSSANETVIVKLRKIAKKSKILSKILANRLYKIADIELRNKIEKLYRDHLALIKLPDPSTIFRDKQKDRAMEQKEQLETEIEQLSDEIIEDICPIYEEWLDFHTDPEKWWNSEEGFGQCIKERGGECPFKYGGITIDIKDVVKEKLTEEGYFEHDSEYLMENMNEELSHQQLDDEMKKYLGHEPEEDDYDKLKSDHAFLEFLIKEEKYEQHFDPEELHGEGWLKEMCDNDPRVQNIIDDVGPEEGYRQWKESIGNLDMTIENIQDAVKRMQKAKTIHDKIVAINQALHVEHVTGSMSEKLDLSSKDLDHLSNLDVPIPLEQTHA